MFRLSCFHTSTISGKQRKTVLLPSEPMPNTAQDSLQAQLPNSHPFPLVSDLSNTMVEGGSVENFADQATDSCAVEFDEETGSKYSIDRDILLRSGGGMTKSCSLGSFLDRKGTGSDIAFEDEVKQSYSDESQDVCRSPALNAVKDSGISVPGHFQEALGSTAIQENYDVVNHGSFGNAQELENLGHVDPNESYREDKSSGNTSQTPSLVKSFSLPHIGSPDRSYGPPFVHSRSAEDLHSLDSGQKETNPELETSFFQHHEDRNLDYKNAHDGDNTYVGSAKDFIVPVGDQASDGRASDPFQWVDLSGKDFTKKRIEDWVLDLQHCSHLESSNDSSAPEIIEVENYDNSLDISYARKEEGKVSSPGMEAATKYISSLSPSATSAQLINLGLATIPFLSPFSSLRALNLSGNAIVRITSGALPRGLHVLNLSKNNIATIEGFKDLIRLRALDLSYNRILKIGHGLSSCSSLKELYLAGNKISEVEGLHRLLKLNVLDLRFNKISTTKCLGQLAANYQSLQVISLEGNPAQRNVGDEQLKKYLQGLLPHLAYYNKHSIKVGSSLMMKDTAERSARLGIGAHQNDRSSSLKADAKNIRKGGGATSSSIHGRRSQQPIVSSTKPSSSRHPRLPSTSSKPITEQDNLKPVTEQDIVTLPKLTNKLLSMKSVLSVRKSRSVGNLSEL